VVAMGSAPRAAWTESAIDMIGGYPPVVYDLGHAMVALPGERW
jgi:hypothetical protein